MPKCLSLPKTKDILKVEVDRFPLQFDLNLALQVKHSWMQDLAEIIGFQYLKSPTEVLIHSSASGFDLRMKVATTSI